MSDQYRQNLGDFDIEIARRIDAACRRFEADWRGGRRRRVEDYVDDGLGDDIRPALRSELEALERELRMSDETVSRSEAGSATATGQPAAPPPRSRKNRLLHREQLGPFPCRAALSPIRCATLATTRFCVKLLAVEWVWFSTPDK